MCGGLAGGVIFQEIGQEYLRLIDRPVRRLPQILLQCRGRRLNKMFHNFKG